MFRIQVFFFYLPISIFALAYEQTLTKEQVKEILELQALTKKISESEETYNNPLESSNVNETDVSFYVYNLTDHSAVHVPYKDADKITTQTAFNLNLPTIFVIHGWIGYYNSSVASALVQAFLQLSDRNIIAVDWDRLSNQLYLAAHAIVPGVGTYVGKFIQNISETYNYSLDNISIIGHSLGAQVTAYAGKQTNGQLSTIIGLDPAGPLYFEQIRDGRLNEDDAKYVLGIHTNAQFLGVNYRVGDADFWPNGGWEQKGCEIDFFGLCSHERSFELFVESTDDNQFVSRECDTYENYINGLCRSNNKALMGGAIINKTITGNYFLNTSAVSPYGLGDVGL